MQVREMMTENPACCSPDTSLQDVAKLMSGCDCGEIPVIDEQRRPVGVVTDRDIACRCVAKGKDPSQTTAREVMSEPVVTVTSEDTVESCCQRMEENQIRRVPVVDEAGACCGMVAQADLVRRVDEHETAEVVRNVSQPTKEASRAGCC
ncbi:MAG: CBS domain-containing protein [Maritimibacter sp.]|nr:CBS domain-containing protein [Maritimibacter sp.]